MPSKVFTDMLRKAQIAGAQAGPSNRSAQWFRDLAKNLTKADVKNIMRDATDKHRNQLMPGYMYAFYYDPKHKATLPYYDKFPLIFPLSVGKDFFIGINFHYLHPTLRAKLMDALYEHVSNEKMNEKTKMQISYDILKSASKYKLFEPCIKKYLKAHVRSRFMKINSNEWDFTLMLPTEQFEKASKQKIWSESRKRVGL